MYDGTNGIRKTNSDDEMGITTENVPATCYPTGAAIGSSWNTELLHEVGEALGNESKEMGVELLLGRNQHEADPLEVFEILLRRSLPDRRVGAAFINGLQSKE